MSNVRTTVTAVVLGVAVASPPGVAAAGTASAAEVKRLGAE
jgi:hypothetical protein